MVFLIGSNHAHHKHKSKHFTYGLIGGVLLNLGGTLLLTVHGLDKPERPQPSIWYDLKKKDIEYITGYLEGYEKIAQRKNGELALAGGLLGTVVSIIIILELLMKFPRFDGHAVKMYLIFMEVSQWSADVNMTVNSRLRLSV